MQLRLPQTINSGHGEMVRFIECVHESDGDRILFEGFVQPGCGPILHVHLQQAEGFEVKQGVMAYQTSGSDVHHLQVGESTVFEKSVPHRFWNCSDEELILVSWAKTSREFAALYDNSVFIDIRSGVQTLQDCSMQRILQCSIEESLMFLKFLVLMKQFVFPVVYWVGRDAWVV